MYRLFGRSLDQAWNDPQVQGFLGYAPVLEALADFLDVRNFQSLATEVRQGMGVARDPWEFLSLVVERILERETSRALDPLRQLLQPVASRSGWSDWGALYKGGEQCSRLLSFHLSTSSSVAIPTLPGAMSSPYEEALRTRLVDHPFLASSRFSNVVFMEYVYAWGISKADDALAAGLRVRMKSRDRPFLPTQMFSQLLRSLHGNGPIVIDAQDFGVLYESLLARAEDMTTDVGQAESEMVATISIGEAAPLEIHLLDTGSGLHIWRRLVDAAVDVDGTVQLGLPTQRFTLGPAVDLRCGHLLLATDDFEVDTSSVVVSIKADRQSALTYPTRLRIRGDRPSHLRVTWPDLSHPWVKHRALSNGGGALLPDTPRGRALWKFLFMFRRQRARAERTILLARRAPDEAQARVDLLKLAVSHGVLRRTQAHAEVLYFNSDFDSLGKLLDDSHELSPTALAFAIEYLEDDAEALRRATGAAAR